MKPNKKLGFAFIITGAVLILSALSLVLYNHIENIAAGKASNDVMKELKSNYIEKTPVANLVIENTEPVIIDGDSLPEEDDVSATEAPEMTEVEIGGYRYVGYISIPNLDLELPIMSEWDYVRLKKSPCRQTGSTKTDDLVIMAHNYNYHFGRIGTLSPGDEVIITDMDGDEIRYAVSYSEKVDPSTPDVILESENDLVLYTCTPGGKQRITVFCDRI